jgi:lysophospholipase L1-like esterase
MKRLLLMLPLIACGKPNVQKALIIGDSLAATNGKMAGHTDHEGWGRYVVINGYKVENAAIPGKSSKSYYDIYWKGIFLLTQPDLLLIEFGGNDIKDDPIRHTDPQTTFKDYLRSYVQEARGRSTDPKSPKLSAAKVVFVLTTDYVDRTNGCVSAPRLEDYVQAMKEVALELDVPVVDAHTESVKMANENCALYYRDTAHLTDAGARRIANTINDQLKSIL